MVAPRISPPQLKAMLHDGLEIALLDVREAGQFGESHLLFATPLPYSRLELDIGPLVPRLAVRIVLCDDGTNGIADLAARRLAQLGYTAVSILDGGVRGWKAAGYEVFAGVNVPSKTFGELVEHEYHTPRITAQDLQRMQAAGEDFIIVDGRPYSEYHKMNIPGGVCCPNAELPYRISTMVRNPKTKIIVNCAGRTRSILGAQTLINFGIPNPVFALENGTQGWYLADYTLEHGATRKYPEHIDEAQLPALQEKARALMQRFNIPTVTGADVGSWLHDGSRTTYLCDVRTPEEFAAGSVAGAVHAPGGQLIQSTDQWIGVRNARVVLLDSEMVRAPVVASWLKQLGCDVHVLQEGIRATVQMPSPPRYQLPSLPVISAAAAHGLLKAGAATALDLGPSMAYRKEHVPGSFWSIRPEIAVDAGDTAGTVILIADDQDVARLAAVDLIEDGIVDVRLLDGGLRGWKDAGLDVMATPDQPPDDECIDYLFFVHDRHAGNRAAMRQYLAWETGLLKQLDEQDLSSFRVGAA